MIAELLSKERRKRKRGKGCLMAALVSQSLIYKKLKENRGLDGVGVERIQS